MWVSTTKLARLEGVTTQTFDDGFGLKPMISTDGHYVVFEASTSTLVQHQSTYGGVLHDTQMGTTTLITHRPDGGSIYNSYIGFSSVSKDGQFVAFESNFSKFVDGQPPASNTSHYKDH